MESRYADGINYKVIKNGEGSNPRAHNFVSCNVFPHDKKHIQIAVYELVGDATRAANLRLSPAEAIKLAHGLIDLATNHTEG